MREIGIRELRDLARGAAVLGTGGGGDPYIGRLLAEQAIAQHGPVTLVDVAEVPDDALVLPSAMMGAPTVMVEKLPRGGEAAGGRRAPETQAGGAAGPPAPPPAGGAAATPPPAGGPP